MSLPDAAIEEARKWITGSGPVDPQLGEFWGSFAVRPGSFHRRRLRTGLHDRGVHPEQSGEDRAGLPGSPVHNGDTFARHEDFVDRELARNDSESTQRNTRVASTTAASWAPSTRKEAGGLRTIGQHGRTTPNEAGANRGQTQAASKTTRELADQARDEFRDAKARETRLPALGSTRSRSPLEGTRAV